MQTDRRFLLGSLALGTGALAARSVLAAVDDGHAAGYDVAPANGVPLVHHNPSDPLKFSMALDSNPIKATSGGWAREVTARHLPIATTIAGAHLFMNPGGSREMHWHGTAAEWAFVLDGHCQVTVLDPAGTMEVANLARGDLWYFPRGHGHAIQTLGDVPCHAVLTFDDGLYSEHGTFGITDWLSAVDPALVALNFGMPKDALASLPKGETYIMQGPVIPLDGPEARAERALSREHSHRYSLLSGKPRHESPGGTLHIATAEDFPVQTTMSTVLVRLRSGAMHELHWHANANEWHYVSRGEVRITMYGANKVMAVADMKVGDCAYIPKGFGHSVLNTGKEPCEIVGVVDAATYEENSLSQWIAAAPAHLLANNLRIDETVRAAFPRSKVTIVSSA